MKKKKSQGKAQKRLAFLKDEKDEKEIQLFEAVQNRSILEPLLDEGLSLGELKHQLEQIKDTPIKKTTLYSRILRLQNSGLIKKQQRRIKNHEIKNPKYRGWRVTKQKNGTFQAELGYELTENGKEALSVIRTFTDQNEDLPQQKKKENEDEKKDE